jgi:hypothetical protein
MKQSPKDQLIALSGKTVSGKWSESSREVKAAVLDQVADVLDHQDGESTSELKDRLLGGEGKGSISNQKLLKLHRIGTRVKNEFGGKKSQLVDKLMDARRGENGKVDETYRTHLEKKSIATLLLLHDHAKKAGDI